MSLLRWYQFSSLTHYEMLQLLIVLCLNFLTKQQLTSQRPGNLLRQSQVGPWSWNVTHLKIHMTHSGGTARDVRREPVPLGSQLKMNNSCSRLQTADHNHPVDAVDCQVQAIRSQMRKRAP